MSRRVYSCDLKPGDHVVGIENADWNLPPEGAYVVATEEYDGGMGIVITWKGEGKRQELWPRYEAWFVENDKELTLSTDKETENG